MAASINAKRPAGRLDLVQPALDGDRSLHACRCSAAAAGAGDYAASPPALFGRFDGFSIRPIPDRCVGNFAVFSDRPGRFPTAIGNFDPPDRNVAFCVR